jgi:hypothetical protein
MFTIARIKPAPANRLRAFLNRTALRISQSLSSGRASRQRDISRRQRKKQHAVERAETAMAAKPNWRYANAAPAKRPGARRRHHGSRLESLDLSSGGALRRPVGVKSDLSPQAGRGNSDRRVSIQLKAIML